MQLLGILDNLEWWQFLAPGVAGTLLYTSLIPDGRNELRWFYVLHIVSFALAGFGIASILPTSATVSWWPASLNYWVAAILSSVVLPILFAFLKNNDLPHKLLRKRFRQKWSITREHQFPTSLASVFNYVFDYVYSNAQVIEEIWITLVLKQDGCYVTGNPYAYPGNDTDQFVLANVRWDCDCCAGKTAGIFIMGMSDVSAVMLNYETKPK